MSDGVIEESVGYRIDALIERLAKVEDEVRRIGALVQTHTRQLECLPKPIGTALPGQEQEREL